VSASMRFKVGLLTWLCNNVRAQRSFGVLASPSLVRPLIGMFL
jgi:hypothetical protein